MLASTTELEDSNPVITAAKSAALVCSQMTYHSLHLEFRAIKVDFAIIYHNRFTDHIGLNKTKTLITRRRSFQVAAPTVWNSLPAHLHLTLICRREFRDGLKSHLFT